MTLHDFYTLSSEAQRKAVQQKGIFLMSRDKEGIRVFLFALEGIYIEAFFNSSLSRIEHVRAFTSVDLLTPYLEKIDITALLL